MQCSSCHTSPWFHCLKTGEFFWLLLYFRSLCVYFYFRTISGVWCFLQLKKNQSFPSHWAAVILFQVRKGPGRGFLSFLFAKENWKSTQQCHVWCPDRNKCKEKKGESSSSSRGAQGCLLTGVAATELSPFSQSLSLCLHSVKVLLNWTRVMPVYDPFYVCKFWFPEESEQALVCTVMSSPKSEHSV